jgi:hypothetical protein
MSTLKIRVALNWLSSAASSSPARNSVLCLLESATLASGVISCYPLISRIFIEHFFLCSLPSSFDATPIELCFIRQMLETSSVFCGMSAELLIFFPLLRGGYSPHVLIISE